jgi:NCAIR mutase (PurE)-related protein
MKNINLNRRQKLDEKTIKRIVKELKKGKISEQEFIESLKNAFIFSDGVLNLDMHRALRHGFPEVIMGEGKEIEDLKKAISHMEKVYPDVLVTRVEPVTGKKLKKIFKNFQYSERGRCFYKHTSKKVLGKGKLLIISAGASDEQVVEEAYITAKVMGNDVEKITDVGVAGLHRLFSFYEKIKSARVLIVVAGMEGALPSVVGGLVDKPVIGVPTSRGYGAGRGGFAALLGMLNSCSPNVVVVNIDNGFGAAYTASLINRL